MTNDEFDPAFCYFAFIRLRAVWLTADQLQADQPQLSRLRARGQYAFTVNPEQAIL